VTRSKKTENVYTSPSTDLRCQSYFSTFFNPSLRNCC